MTAKSPAFPFSRLAWVFLSIPFVLAMVRDGYADPYVAALEGTRRYGHNHATALRDGLVMLAIELALVTLLVPSWTPKAPAWRAGVALVLFGLFVPIAAIATMHAGGIVLLHLVWVLVVTLVLLVLTAARVVVWMGKPPT